MRLLVSSLILILFCTNCNSGININRVGVKEFVRNHIHKNELTIDSLVQTISKSKHDYRLLLNKALRFKMFFSGQDCSTEILANKNSEKALELKVANELVKSEYYQGIENSDFLYKKAVQSDSQIEKKIKELKEKQYSVFNQSLAANAEACHNVVLELDRRKRGIFPNDVQGCNVLQFNFLLNPVLEIGKGFTKTYNTFNVDPDLACMFSLEIPKSWIVKEKSEYTVNSTLGTFEPNEKFLNSNITLSVLKDSMFVDPKIADLEIDDNDMVDLVFKDDDLLHNFIKAFNKSSLGENIDCTLFPNGNKKMILYTHGYDLGVVTNNDMLNGYNMKLLNALTFVDGMPVDISCGASIDIEGFNSYDYYSSLFFYVIRSLRYKEIKDDVIYLSKENNMNYIDVDLKGKTYKFLFDTGASGIVINKRTLKDLLQRRVIFDNMIIGNSLVEIANGEIIECEQWMLPILKIGRHEFKNVEISVIDTEDSMLLFGMDGVKLLNVSEINLDKGELVMQL